MYAARPARHAQLKTRRLHDQHVTRELIEHSLGRVADEQALQPRAGDRAHDHQGAPNLTGRLLYGIDRVTAYEVTAGPRNPVTAQRPIETALSFACDLRHTLRQSLRTRRVGRHDGARDRDIGVNG